ncbi:MAG: glycosyltransferase [Labilithrix sp.]|nr:glycosyltransferase [Labilithrix sp.]MCW5818034.1 glycosyltransferase [Labilithrix sp.]
MASLGLLPLVGALVSIGWMLFVPRHATHAHEIRDALLGVLSHPVGVVVVVQSLYTALLSVLWLRYRPFTAPEGKPRPRVSVVIPAFNEGPMVERSIRSVATCAYPKDLLEIIVVDDGSRDDTFFHMQRLRREHAGIIKLVRFTGNRGKREALVAGFRAATGQILVTIDSDSEIDPSTIDEMVAPFLADPDVGAVAGRVSVLNRDTTISRMLEVQYALAFDFGRAAQSTYRCVACCPGALSAFRREVVLPFLDEWADQKFLGRPVNHGEDQALTNIVLRQGYDTVYQRTAVVHTLAPVTYGQMSRMFVRWDRSYLVEGFSFAKFMLTRYRAKNRVLPVVTFLVSNLRLFLFFYALVSLPTVFDAQLNVLVHSTIALLVGATFTALYYLRIERSARFLYGVLYAIYSVLLLQWILPWALLTVRDERWGTR